MKFWGSYFLFLSRSRFIRGDSQSIYFLLALSFAFLFVAQVFVLNKKLLLCGSNFFACSWWLIYIIECISPSTQPSHYPDFWFLHQYANILSCLNHCNRHFILPLILILTSPILIQIVIEQKERLANVSADVLLGKLSLIDLAGSERATVTQVDISLCCFMCASYLNDVIKLTLINQPYFRVWHISNILRHYTNNIDCIPWRKKKNYSSWH